MSVGVVGVTAAQQYEQTFYSSGTFTVPTGVKSVEVVCAGGGGGCTVAASVTYGGGGGGYYRGFFNVTPGQVIPVTVGAGGKTVYTACSGGNSSFGDYVTSTGGGINLNATPQPSGYYYFPNTRGNTTVFANTSNATTGYTANLVGAASGAIKWNGSYYLMIPSAGTSIWKSTNGYTWTQISSQVSNLATAGTYDHSIDYGNGVWVIAGGATSGTYLTSVDDGVTWTARTLPGSWVSSTAVSYANGKWFLTNGTATGTIAFTTDPTNAASWTTTGAIGGASTNRWGKVGYANGVHFMGTFYSSGTGTIRFASSTDGGSNWATTTMGSTHTSPTTSTYCFYSNGYYIVMDGGGNIFASSDLTTWGSNISSGVSSMSVDDYGVLTYVSAATPYTTTAPAFVSRTMATASTTLRAFYSGATTRMIIPDTAGASTTNIIGYFGEGSGNIGSWNSSGENSGGGAGGPAITAAFYSGSSVNYTNNAGAGIDNYCIGGAKASTGSNSYNQKFGSGGSYVSNSIYWSGMQGLVKVRWWA